MIREKFAYDLDSPLIYYVTTLIAQVPDVAREVFLNKSTWLRNNQGPEDKVLRYMHELFNNRRKDILENTHIDVTTNWPRLCDNINVVSLKNDTDSPKFLRTVQYFFYLKSLPILRLSRNLT